MISQYYTSQDLNKMGIRSVGENVQVSKDCVITGLGNISIGSNVRIDSYNILLAQRGWLEIGSNVHIEPMSSLVAHHGISIGSFCTVSHGVRLFTASANYDGHYFTNVFPNRDLQKPKVGPIIIRDHVIIGANSVIMPDLTLHEGAAVGALSFIRETLDGWMIYGGNPLKTIAHRETKIKSIADTLLDS
jgi:acetyltransferase-like isoleucine patch superfamily enzyme